MSTQTGTANNSSSVTGGSGGGRFPYSIVPDNEVNISVQNSTITRFDSTSNNIFCKICNYPMIYVITLLPCKHKICYSCFDSNYTDYIKSNL